MTITAEICLYGCRSAGFDYLARTQGDDGRPVFTAHSQPDPTRLRYESPTECIFRAQRELVDAGARGTVAVYAPGGERVAYVELGAATYFGSMPWQAAPVYTLKVA